jgi:transcriptional regulator with XRE-family HTH domain
MNVRKRFGKYLRARRTAQGLTLRDLSRLSGIPHNTLHGLESGRSEARLGQILQLAKAFREPISTFLPDLNDVNLATLLRTIWRQG